MVYLNSLIEVEERVQQSIRQRISHSTKKNPAYVMNGIKREDVSRGPKWVWVRISWCTVGVAKLQTKEKAVRKFRYFNSKFQSYFS